MTESIYHINNLVHTIIGSIALLGALGALMSVKGSARHKTAGRVFVWFILFSAVTSFYPTFYKFSEIGPLALILAMATIYLVITAVIAVRYQTAEPLMIEKCLPVVPLLLLILPVIRVFLAIKTNNFDIFFGPLLLASLFIYLLVQDLAILVNRQRSREFWIQRHLTRIIFAFSIGVMAVVRIGVNFGLTFEMSVILPLLGALGLVVFFRWRIA
ncbi:hypothetical protein [Aliiglaciecola litoralis]|uniref:DUF2306 domain-containing protein n=1 Tax=Aliiglaciecola litoralis TaxID=582857 RepID=A0ABN1LQF0_9ALTE